MRSWISRTSILTANLMGWFMGDSWEILGEISGHMLYMLSNGIKTMVTQKKKPKIYLTLLQMTRGLVGRQQDDPYDLTSGRCCWFETIPVGALKVGLVKSNPTVWSNFHYHVIIPLESSFLLPTIRLNISKPHHVPFLDLMSISQLIIFYALKFYQQHPKSF